MFPDAANTSISNPKAVKLCEMLKKHFNSTLLHVDHCVIECYWYLQSVESGGQAGEGYSPSLQPSKVKFINLFCAL